MDTKLTTTLILPLSLSFVGGSSEDGRSASVARQKELYDAAVKAHPSTILSLEHEVHSEHRISLAVEMDWILIDVMRTGTSVYEVLPYAIEKLKAAGYQFVTVAECLNMRPYQTIRAPAFRDVSDPSIFRSHSPTYIAATAYVVMLNYLG